MGSLEGKIAVVTGGGSGIGAATVDHFVAEGARVVVADIDVAGGEEVASRHGEAAMFVPTDVSISDQVARAVDTAVETWGGLDCIFNNAGHPGAAGGVTEVDPDAWDDTMAVLLKGVMLGIRHSVPHMRNRGGGSIINTASVAGLRVGYGPMTYSVAKAAVIHLTRMAAAELAGDGIRVNAICPGGINTPIFTRFEGMTDELRPLVEQFMAQNMPNMQPIRRAGEPSDIAAAAVYLAGDGASFVTGHHLVVDGGLIMGRMTDDSEEGMAERLAAFLGGDGQ